MFDMLLLFLIRYFSEDINLDKFLNWLFKHQVFVIYVLRAALIIFCVKLDFIFTVEVCSFIYIFIYSLFLLVLEICSVMF